MNFSIWDFELSLIGPSKYSCNDLSISLILSESEHPKRSPRICRILFIKSIICSPFQFLYGATESASHHLFLIQWKFQFLYGATESSTFPFCFGHIRISIPLWCDWKYYRALIFDSLTLFQFLYGATERRTVI